MRTPAILLSAAIIALSFSSCNIKEKYARNAAASTAYLADSKTAAAKTSFKGVWHSDKWGFLSLAQKSGKITGMTDEFQIEGVVSGRTAYLVFIADSWTFYSVKLTKKDYNTLTGFYAYDVPYSEKEQEAVTLKRVEN